MLSDTVSITKGERFAPRNLATVSGKKRRQRNFDLEERTANLIYILGVKEEIEYVTVYQKSLKRLSELLWPIKR